MSNRDDFDATPPPALGDLRMLIHDRLLPLARSSGVIGESEEVEALAWKPSKAGKMSEAQEVLGLVLTMAASAFAVWKHEPEGTEWARLAGAAGSLGQFAHGYFSAKAGEVDVAKKLLATIAANARHAPSRDAKALVLEWWAVHGKGKMKKSEAADEIKRLNLVSEARDTVRDWLRNQ